MRVRVGGVAEIVKVTVINRLLKSVPDVLNFLYKEVSKTVARTVASLCDGSLRGPLKLSILSTVLKRTV